MFWRFCAFLGGFSGLLVTQAPSPCFSRLLEQEITAIKQAKLDAENAEKVDLRAQLADRLGVSSRIISDDDYIDQLKERTDTWGVRRYSCNFGEESIDIRNELLSQLGLKRKNGIQAYICCCVH